MTSASAIPMLAFLARRDDAPAYWQMGILWIMLATAKDTGGQFTLMEQLMTAGPQAPPHLHEAQREGFYMLEGQARFTVNERHIEAGPGDFLTVPEKTWHSFECVTKVRLLNWYTPAGFERIIIEAGQPTTIRSLPPPDLPPPTRHWSADWRARLGCRHDNERHRIRTMTDEAPIIAVAGAGGDLGGRIARALAKRGAAVRALVRHDLSANERARIEATGATLAAADPADAVALADACADAACVVSALSGLRPVLIARQSILLDAAVAAGVPRFIPSDFSEDFTRTPPGGNRNLDLRREFMARADLAPIQVTSILNGAFMDMLGAEMPLIQKRIRRVIYWRSADQPLDFTTKDDVAAYTAAAALDDEAPRILRIAGDTVTVSEIARALTGISGVSYKPLGAGGLGVLSAMIRVARLVAPQPNETFPPWQGMQYMRDMFSGAGKLHPLDNHRYPGVHWTRVEEHLRRLEHS